MTDELERPRVVLPASVHQRLGELTKSLEARLGPGLVGVIVHGAVVCGGYRPGETEVEVVVILASAGLDALRSVAEPIQQARYAARIETTFLVASEIAAASDAFPLLYDDIKRYGVLVHGRDPFADVEVHDASRRLRVERELREAQIRLRCAVTDAGGEPEAIHGAVVRKTKQLRAPLHALLRLKGLACKPDLSSVLTKLEETYGLELAKLRVHPAGDPSDDPPEPPDAAHAALSALLEKTLADLLSDGAPDTSLQT